MPLVKERFTSKGKVRKELAWLLLNERNIELTKNNTHTLCNIE